MEASAGGEEFADLQPLEVPDFWGALHSHGSEPLEEEEEAQALDADRLLRARAAAAKTSAYAELLADVVLPAELLEAGEELLYVDVRRTAERAVSTLPRAVKLGRLTADPGLAAGKDVVIYDTCGERSAHWVQELRSLGGPWSSLRACDLGLVGWAHAGGPLEDGRTGQPTRCVHACTGRFAELFPLGYLVVESELGRGVFAPPRVRQSDDLYALSGGSVTDFFARADGGGCATPPAWNDTAGVPPAPGLPPTCDVR